MNDKKFEKAVRSWLADPAKVLLNPTPGNVIRLRNNLLNLQRFYQTKTNKEEHHEYQQFIHRHLHEGC
tara:strand:- start:1250 stop:1453 length:204 start_codon:yes stop_codon:yes gene_type:complete